MMTVNPVSESLSITVRVFWSGQRKEAWPGKAT